MLTLQGPCRRSLNKVCSCFSTYAGSSPHTGPEDLRFSFGYLEYHSDGRHWKLEEWMTISMRFCAKLDRHLDLRAGKLLFLSCVQVLLICKFTVQKNVGAAFLEREKGKKAYFRFQIAVAKKEDKSPPPHGTLQKCKAEGTDEICAFIISSLHEEDAKSYNSLRRSPSCSWVDWFPLRPRRRPPHPRQPWSTRP